MFIPSVFAEETGGGGNPITDSAPFKGAVKLFNDASLALLIIAPIVCGLLIGAFSIVMGLQSEDHDKLKWKNNRKTVVIVLIWVFSASAVIKLITHYFTPTVL